MDVEGRRVPGTRFFAHCVGQTSGAHVAFISKIKCIGHHQVLAYEDSDYDLMFCPIVSRIGTDIDEAMTKLRAGKQTILVVMHHTYDPGHMVIKSSRHVDNKDVVLTVDCLFYNGKLLQCKLNDEAWAEIQRCLGAPPSTMVSGVMKNLVYWLCHERILSFKTVVIMVSATALYLFYKRWVTNKIHED